MPGAQGLRVVLCPARRPGRASVRDSAVDKGIARRRLPARRLDGRQLGQRHGPRAHGKPGGEFAIIQPLAGDLQDQPLRTHLRQLAQPLRRRSGFARPGLPLAAALALPALDPQSGPFHRRQLQLLPGLLAAQRRPLVERQRQCGIAGQRAQPVDAQGGNRPLLAAAALQQLDAQHQQCLAGAAGMPVDRHLLRPATLTQLGQQAAGRRLRHSLAQQWQQLVLARGRHPQRQPQAHAPHSLRLLQRQLDGALPGRPQRRPGPLGRARCRRQRPGQLANHLIQLVQRLRSADQQAQVGAAIVAPLPGTQVGEKTRIAGVQGVARAGMETRQRMLRMQLPGNRPLQLAVAIRAARPVFGLQHLALGLQARVRQ
ncbi:hypothetical protein D9M71_366340 [compost metagenome]